ncbi:MAG: hypothetical protein IJ694_09410 [Acidaminococcaceae bacterium]|nr:hypothetical protein [Acidaminococcaceae bacterium]
MELVFGLFLFAAGAYLMVQANVGLSSWWALDIGLANLTGIDYGTVHNVVALAVLLLDILLKEKIGWGMVADALLIGTFIVIFNQFQAVPLFQTLLGGVACTIAGLLLCGIGSYYYMDAGFGCGRRKFRRRCTEKERPDLVIDNERMYHGEIFRRYKGSEY